MKKLSASIRSNILKIVVLSILRQPIREIALPIRGMQGQYIMKTIENSLPGVPDVESPFFERLFRAKDLSPDTLQVARKLHDDGFAVIDFPDPEFDQVASEIIRKLHTRYDWQAWREGKVEGLRVQDAWTNVPEVKRLACNPAVLDLLYDLYGRRAFPFQTLNFPVGTQQHFHTDSVHFSSSPERFMVGVWIALEDIDSDNGPLIYYPGSHKLPIFTNEHVGISPDTQAPHPYGHYHAYEKAWEAIVDDLALKPIEFHAKRGQALIWAANLLHGGAAQTNQNRTRYSQVTHYYFQDCAYYTPMASLPFLGPVLFRQLVDIRTGEPVPNRQNGTEIEASHIEYTRPANFKNLRHSAAAVELPADFDAENYLRANPDVAAAKVDPVAHWFKHGRFEGRLLRPAEEGGTAASTVQ